MNTKKKYLNKQKEQQRSTPNSGCSASTANVPMIMFGRYNMCSMITIKGSAQAHTAMHGYTLDRM